MDISETLAPNSDQLDAVDLAATGPKIFTIADVVHGNSEQPVQIKLAEFPRPWRPGKSMRRVLATCWGVDASKWAGRRVELFCDPDVKFGGQSVGGTRISRLSHIDGTKKIPLLVTRGKSATYKVEPLTEPEPPTPVTEETLAVLTDTLARKGIPEASWLSGANSITGGNAASLQQLSEDDARRVLASLDQRPDVEADQ